MSLNPGDLVKISSLVAIKYYAGKYGVITKLAMTYEADSVDTAAQSGNYFRVAIGSADEDSHIFHEGELTLVSKGKKEN